MTLSLIWHGLMLVVLLIANDAFAWDGSRKGFILSGGPAIGGVRVNQSTRISSDNNSYFALGANFRMGYAPTNRIAIVYAAESSYFNAHSPQTGTSTFAQQILGVGAMYWYRESAPSPFITGTVGLGIFDRLGQSSENEYGFGVGVTAGFELKPHVSLHGGLKFTSTDKTISRVRTDTNVVSFRINVSFTGY